MQTKLFKVNLMLADKSFLCQMFVSAASVPHWTYAEERWAGEVGKGVDLSREGGVGGRELGRDMFEGRAGLRKRVGGREGRRLAAAVDAGGWLSPAARLAACDQKDKSAHTGVSDNRQYAGHLKRSGK